MNVQRIISNIRNANTALQHIEQMSKEQRIVYRKSRAKYKKMLKALIDPNEPARPLPPKPNQLKLI